MAWAEIGTRLDRQGGTHLYRQIADQLREQVRLGGLRPGDAVPPQRELSALWGIGEVTVRRALQSLALEGLVEARPGAGTVVRGTGGTAESLSRDRSGPLRLGVAFADLANGYPFFPPVLRGVRSGDRDVAVRLFDLPASETARGSPLHPPPLDDLDGLIMMSPVNLGLLATCQSRGLPTVLLFNDLADGFSRCILPDYASGVAQAVRRLVSRGRTKIALVTANAERFSTGRWCDAYRAALQLHGLSGDPAWIVHADYTEPAGADATRRLLALPNPPDAILFAADTMARGGLIAARDAGVRVPDRLAIVGAGDAEEPTAWTTPLTLIDLALREIGALARESIEHFHDEPPTPFRRVATARLVIGETA